MFQKKKLSCVIVNYSSAQACLHFLPYRCTKNMQTPLMRLMTDKIVIDQPLPILSISVGAIKGVQPADMHRKRLAALITDAEWFW